MAHLSARGAALIKAPQPYYRVFADLQSRQWSETDPDGNIIVVVAENKLSSGLVHERLQRCAPPPEDVLHYPRSWKGHERLRRGFASLLERTFMKGVTLNPEHIIVLAGAGAVLNNLFYAILEEGQGVLIPRPYYPAFDNDLRTKAGLVPVPFTLDESRGSGDIPRQLDKAVAHALSEGKAQIRAVLLTNPNNPLSTMYTRETLVAVLRWCMEHEVHLISDEIYALSVWGEGAREMVSLEAIAREEQAGLPGGEERVKQLLHIVFGLSKDFCASGLRMGCLHTRNETLVQVIFNLAYFCACSAHTQLVVAELLEDAAWMDGFLEENRRRMRHSYTLLSGALKEARIPFVPADSAMFCWIDLREGLLPAATPTAQRQGDESGGGGGGAAAAAASSSGEDGDSFAAETELWQELAYKHGVLMTPGSTCHATEPGFFRMCWAWVPAEALPVAVRRIRVALDERKLQQSAV